MSSIRSLGRKLAYEGIDDTDPVDTNADAAELEGRSDATAQQEILADAEEIVSIDSAIEDILEGTDVLEDQAAIVDPEVTGDAGVAPETAEAIQVSVESFRKRLGITRVITFPAREDYTNKNTRVQAGVYCHEGVWETIKDAWKKVVAFFKSMFAKVKAFVIRIVTAIGRLKARAESLKAKCGKTRGEKKEDTFKNKRIANAFTDKSGKFKTSNITEQLTTVAKDTPALAEVAKLAAAAVKEVAEKVKGMNVKTVGEIEKVTAQFNDIADGVLLKSLAIAKVEADTNTKKEFTAIKAYTTPALPGNRALVFYSTGVAGKKITIHMAEVNLGATKDIDEEIEVAKTSEINHICDLTIEVAEALEKLSKAEEKDDSVVKTIEELSNKIEGKVKESEKDKATLTAAKEALSDARQACLSNGRFAASITTKWASIALFGAGKALDYAAESLSCYEAE